MKRKLRRITWNNWIGGVCAGFAYWIGVPTWLVRLVWTATVFFYGVGVIPYVLLWIFVPTWDSDPEDYDDVSGG